CWATIERARAEAEAHEREMVSTLRADIAGQLDQAESLDNILRGCCQLLVRHLDAAFARVWLLDPHENVLVLRASAGIYTHLDGPHSRVPVGEFKIGRIAQNKQPHLTNDVTHDPNVSDPEWARRERMTAFAGYPLLVEGRVLGVIALFARHELSAAVLGDLEPISNAIAQDVERRRSEAALHASENLKTAILDTALDGFILMNHEGSIVDWNMAAENIFKLQRADATGRLLAETIVPERLREAHRQGLARYVATRAARILGRRYELPAIRSDGSEFPCEISITHIPATEPPLFAGYVRDITERKANEAALMAATERAESAALAVAQSAERFRLLSEVVSLQVWTAQPNGELDFANKNCFEYFGVSRDEEVLGNAWANFVNPDDLPGAQAAWQRALATGDRYEVEFRLRRSDGGFRWFLVRAEAMRDREGRIAKWFGSNTDIDDLKIAQGEAERASRAKDNFLAVLSHELRTPLTPVLLTAAALREDERLPADVRSQLGMMERNIALEARLIDDNARPHSHRQRQAAPANATLRRPFANRPRTRNSA
ncbi:MAG: PAS domain S-box protein, partial [Verrucomicrobiota bacterium]|nr:PAS domain S-box protein [Verrucomicrobiota bacterium]